MKAAVLEDVATLVVREAPDPRPREDEAVVRIRAVGVCGTDLHLFQGHANYRFDAAGKLVPLREMPQILGHEFMGEVVETGRAVRDLKVGDRVICDQGLNCHSQNISPLCRYCATGDSHQCAHYLEHGITIPTGALCEYLAIAAVNCVRIERDVADVRAALSEPLGCVLHSSRRVEVSAARFTFDGAEPIRNVLICGAGPAGLLFLQYLRQVRRFDGLILITDLRDNNLALAKRFGGTALNVNKVDVIEAVRDATRGALIHYLIESAGNPIIFAQMPSLLAKQATVLFYGHGHRGGDLGLMDNILFLEPTMVASVGASGGFDADGRPAIYRRALELVSSGTIEVEPFVTHRYAGLENIHWAFERDFQQPDYIKGVMLEG
jgi:L-iditol 2-dehydrogenase